MIILIAFCNSILVYNGSKSQEHKFIFLKILIEVTICNSCVESFKNDSEICQKWL